MGQHIVKQPDGKYAIFSSNVDRFIAYDATADEIREHFRYIAIENSDRQTKRGLEDADKYGDERLERYLNTVRVIHGDAEANEDAAFVGKVSGAPAPHREKSVRAGNEESEPK